MVEADGALTMTFVEDLAPADMHPEGLFGDFWGVGNPHLNPIRTSVADYLDEKENSFPFCLKLGTTHQGNPAPDPLLIACRRCSRSPDRAPGYGVIFMEP